MGVCVRIWAGADGDDGDGDDDDGDRVSDGNHSTRSTWTSGLATSTSASKLPQTYSLLLAKASTDIEPSISQSFHKLRVFHRPEASRGKLYSFRICSYMLDSGTC